MLDWFKRLDLPSKIMVGGVLVLFLAVLVLLPIGIVTHDEPGLLTACDTSSGVLDYTGSCFEVKWTRDQFPLTVHVSTSNPHPAADPERTTTNAIDLINSRLGFTAFRTVSGPAADVVIDFEGVQDVGNPWMRHSGGAVLHSRLDGRLRCSVRTWNNGTVELVGKVMVHELGHCLGLADDDFTDSAMYPNYTPDEARISVPRITDHDRDLLRGLYVQ